MIRTFVAVDVPAYLRESIEDVLSDLSLIEGIKAVQPSNIHVSLKFLGDIKSSQMPDISKKLDGVECSPFTCKISKVGVFPSSSKPRVVWLGLEGNFNELHLQVEDALDGMGFKKDNREYASHATIGRIKSLKDEQKENLKNFLEEYKAETFGEFEVDRFQFKKSTLTPQGPVYKTLHKVSL